jgi:hypothetical protein
MELEIFINSQDQSTNSLKNMIDYSNKMLNNKLKIKIYDISKSKDKKLAEKYGIQELPALMLEKVRISGQINEFFVLASIAQLLTTNGDDKNASEFLLEEKESDMKLNLASSFLSHLTQIREDTFNYLLLIRPSTDDYNPDLIKEIINPQLKIFILTNFENGSKSSEIAALGADENVLMGHILRANIHMTIAITIRKGRPFFGSFIRGKNSDGKWIGKWSPLLRDTVGELKDFFGPLFNTSSPVLLDGTIPVPMEVNRLVAKVKDNMELIKRIFY